MGATFDGTLTWVGHGTFLLETGGQRILLDAFVDNCPTTPEELKGAGLGDLDLILITHGHMDHMADATAHHDRTGAPLAGMVEMMDWFASKGGVEQDKVIDFGIGGTIEAAGVRVTMVPALHSSSLPDGTYAGLASGFVIELANGYRIYFAGDTDVFGDMRLIGQLHSPDLAILPIGGHYTMDPRQAAKALDLLGTKHVIGKHYGTFPPLTGRPTELGELVATMGVTVHELEPGGTWSGS